MRKAKGKCNEYQSRVFTRKEIKEQLQGPRTTMMQNQESKAKEPITQEGLWGCTIGGLALCVLKVQRLLVGAEVNQIARGCEISWIVWKMK